MDENIYLTLKTSELRLLFYVKKKNVNAWELSSEVKFHWRSLR